jgi:hypothetical protein
MFICNPSNFSNTGINISDGCFMKRILNSEKKKKGGGVISAEFDIET